MRLFSAIEMRGLACAVSVAVWGVALVGCGGSSSETPWPVEPYDIVEAPAGESAERATPIAIDPEKAGPVRVAPPPSRPGGVSAPPSEPSEGSPQDGEAPKPRGADDTEQR